MGDFSIKYNNEPVYNLIINGEVQKELSLNNSVVKTDLSYKTDNYVIKDFYDATKTFVQMRVIQLLSSKNDERAARLFVYFKMTEDEKFCYIGNIEIDNNFRIEDVQSIIDNIVLNGDNDISSISSEDFTGVVKLVHTNFSNSLTEGLDSFIFNKINEQIVHNKIITIDNKNYLCLEDIEDNSKNVWTYLYVPYKVEETIRIFIIAVLKELAQTVQNNTSSIGLELNQLPETSKLDLYNYSTENFFASARPSNFNSLNIENYTGYDTIVSLSPTGQKWPLDNRKYDQVINLRDLAFSLDGENFYSFITSDSKNNNEYYYNTEKGIRYIPMGTIDIAAFRKHKEEIFKNEQPVEIFTKTDTGKIIENYYLYKIEDKKEKDYSTFYNNGDIIIGSKNHITINILNNNLCDKYIETPYTEGIDLYIKKQIDKGGEEYVLIDRTKISDEEKGYLTFYKKEVLSGFNGIYLALKKESNIKLGSILKWVGDSKQPEDITSITHFAQETEDNEGNFEIFSKGFNITNIEGKELEPSGFYNLGEEYLNLSQQIGFNKRFIFTPVEGNYYADYSNRLNFIKFSEGEVNITNGEKYNTDKNNKTKESFTSSFMKPRKDVGFLGIGGYLYGELPKVGEDDFSNNRENLLVEQNEIVTINNIKYEVTEEKVVDLSTLEEFYPQFNEETNTYSVTIKGINCTYVYSDNHYTFTIPSSDKSSTEGKANTTVTSETITSLKFSEIEGDLNFIEIINQLDNQSIQRIKYNSFEGANLTDLIIPKNKEFIIDKKSFGELSNLKQIRCYPTKNNIINLQGGTVNNREDIEGHLWLGDEIFEGSKLTDIQYIFNSYNNNDSIIFLGDKVFNNSYLKTFNYKDNWIFKNSLEDTLYGTSFLENINGQQIISKKLNEASLICGSKIKEVISNDILKTSDLEDICKKFKFTSYGEKILYSGINTFTRVKLNSAKDSSLFFTGKQDLNYIAILEGSDLLKSEGQTELKKIPKLFETNSGYLELFIDKNFVDYQILENLRPNKITINNLETLNQKYEPINCSNLEELIINNFSNNGVINSIFTQNLNNLNLSINNMSINSETYSNNVLKNLVPTKLNLLKFETPQTNFKFDFKIDNLKELIANESFFLNADSDYVKDILAKLQNKLTILIRNNNPMTTLINAHSAIEELTINANPFLGNIKNLSSIIPSQAFASFDNLKEINLSKELFFEYTDKEGNKTFLTTIQNKSFGCLTNPHKCTVYIILDEFQGQKDFFEKLDAKYDAFYGKNNKYYFYADDNFKLTRLELNTLFPKHSTLHFCYINNGNRIIYKTRNIENTDNINIKPNEEYNNLEKYSYYTLENNFKYNDDPNKVENNNEPK